MTVGLAFLSESWDLSTHLCKGGTLEEEPGDGQNEMATIAMCRVLLAVSPHTPFFYFYFLRVTEAPFLA